MKQDWAFAARETPNVRGYSIGPRHLGWLCVKCGAAGGPLYGALQPSLDVQCGIAASEQVNPGAYIDESARFIELGEICLSHRAQRACFEHLQSHIRFETIDRV